MKRKLVTLLTLCMVLCTAVCGLTACTEQEPQHQHVYNKRVASDTYLKSQATCTTKATYYYSCECGLKDSLTFEDGNVLEHSFTNYVYDDNGTCNENGTETAVCDNAGCLETHTRTKENSALDHDYGDWVSNGNNTHSKTCANDSRHVITENCSGGTATETNRPICEHCGEEYGYILGTSGLVFSLNSDETEYLITDYTGTSTEVYIPMMYNGLPVTSIGDYAFSWCDSLTSVVIPESVINIGKSAFSNCESLTSLIIPNSVINIDDWAFASCKSLTNLAIPNSVTNIGNWAFHYCISLKNVTISKSVASIGEDAFYYCRSLINIEVAEENESYKDINGNLYSKDGKILIKYAIGKQNTNFIIPENVIKILSTTFEFCDSLEAIVIPNSVTSIGNGAFWYCSSLTRITVDENNTTYKSIDANLYSKDGKILIRYAIGKTATSFTIPDSVTTISYKAFSDCSSLTSVTIGNSVTSIGSYAFEDCSSLTSITIPDSVTSIGDGAFSNCDSLTSIIIPDSVTSIGSNAFNSCSSLTSITIPDSVTSIAYYAFSNCNSLETIYCEVESQPSGWDSNWNYNCSAEVVWNYKEN